MSKISEAKERQGYVEKAVPQTCVNCKSFTFDSIDKEFFSGVSITKWKEDKNLRCIVGGFAVKKMATCDLFQKR